MDRQRHARCDLRDLAEDRPILQHQADLAVVLHDLTKLGLELAAIGAIVVEPLDDGDVAIGIADHRKFGVAQYQGFSQHRIFLRVHGARSEQPAAIRAEILAAAPGAREIGDRAQAIETAVRLLKAGDALVIAGKGHETGQIVGDKTLPFSDHESAQAALKEVAA